MCVLLQVLAGHSQGQSTSIPSVPLDCTVDVHQSNYHVYHFCGKSSQRVGRTVGVHSIPRCKLMLIYVSLLTIILWSCHQHQHFSKCLIHTQIDRQWCLLRTIVPNRLMKVQWLVVLVVAEFSPYCLVSTSANVSHHYSISAKYVLMFSPTV